MASRRGAVKINPVTGKLEKVEATTGPDGVSKHRDGCMVVDERYVNAAKELGLGGEAGMYSHIKALVRVGAKDIPVGTSIHTEGSAAARDKPTLNVRDTAAVAKAIAAAAQTSKKSVGVAKVHGLGGGGAKSSIHNHEDSFQRRKGVVNTVGGAKDVTRASKEEPARLPAKGERKGAQIMGFGTLDAHTAEGKARREAAEKRESAGGNAIKMTTVHVSGGGGRSMGSGGVAASHPRASVGGGLGVSSSAMGTTAAPPAAEARKAVTQVLGGNASAGNAQLMSNDELRAKRAAHFEKMAAEALAKKHAGAVAAGMRAA